MDCKEDTNFPAL